MKYLLVVLLFVQGCGYTLAHQLILAPEDKELKQDTTEGVEA